MQELLGETRKVVHVLFLARIRNKIRVKKLKVFLETKCEYELICQSKMKRVFKLSVIQKVGFERSHDN